MTAKEREVQIGAQGRMVVPSALRKALNLNPGDRLIARQDGESLILEPSSVLRTRLKHRFKNVSADTSLVDELLDERRREARAEAGLD